MIFMTGQVVNMYYDGGTCAWSGGGGGGSKYDTYIIIKAHGVVMCHNKQTIC